MEKKDLINKLIDISEEIGNLPDDSSLRTTVQDLMNIQGKVDKLLNDLEDEDTN